MQNAKTILVCCCGILAGVGLSMLFTCNRTGKMASVSSPEELSRQAAQAAHHFLQATDSLSTHARNLQAKLDYTTQILAKSKLQNQVLAAEVQQLATKNYPTTDTAIILQDCDSLKSKSIQWAKANAEKDSLYETTINIQAGQLTIKDSIVQLQSQQYNILEGLFNQSLLQQQLLEAQQKSNARLFRRQQFKTKLLAACILLAAGMTTHYLAK